MASKTVLVVDDNLMNRKLLEGMLQIAQAQMLSAEDGAEALRVAKSHHPDLILMDVQLPDMDGFEVVAEIHKDPDLATIPYFYLTGNITAECRRQAEGEGCLGIVQKPISVVEFIETLKKVLT
jgi:two-component system, cell cycle response regulator DivK